MSIKKLTLVFLLPIVAATATAARAQLTVTDTASAATLVQQLVGPGVVYYNPVLTCPSGASGQFSIVGASNLGLDEGIVLTTGRVVTDLTTGIAGINGPQVTTFATTCNQGGSDTGMKALSDLAKQPTHDACRLEFDFVPDGDSLQFNYVFGSEEYEGFSCTQFNDVFAFFLSGPGITGSPNIALIPGTSIPVAINSTTDTSVMHPPVTTLCTSFAPGAPFVQYYNDNSADTMISYYGLTKLLTARARVIPCSTYHIIIAIADASDCVLDSGVMLEKGSFSSNSVKLSIHNHLGSSYPFIVEGCDGDTITAKRPAALNYAQAVYLSYGGGTTRNVDYINAPDSLVIPAGDTTASIIISALADNVAEGDETIVVRVLNTCTRQPIDSIEVLVKDFLPFTVGNDTALCQYDTVLLSASGDMPDDSAWVWNWSSMPPFLGIDGQGGKHAAAKVDTSTTFYVSAVYKGCKTDTQSLFARVEPIPIVNIKDSVLTVCLKEPMTIEVDPTKPSWFTGYTYRWSPPDSLDDRTLLQPRFFAQQPHTYHYVLRATTPLGCTGADEIIIYARPPLLTLTASPADTTIHYGDQIQMYARGANVYLWTPLNDLSDARSPAPYVRPTANTVYTVTGLNEWGCSDTRLVRIKVDPAWNYSVPTAFTPNGDGRNDYFHVANIGYGVLQEFRVFNRWGAEVFSTNNNDPGWDGTYNGQPCEMGVYYFLIRVGEATGNSKMFKGEVTLVR